jgi:hypothetical protein
MVVSAMQTEFEVDYLVASSRSRMGGFFSRVLEVCVSVVNPIKQTPVPSYRNALLLSTTAGYVVNLRMP